MNEQEFKNVLYVKNLCKDLLEAVNNSDGDRMQELKGELRAMSNIITPLEIAMGSIVAAIAEYQRSTRKIEEQEPEDEPKRKQVK